MADYKRLDPNGLLYLWQKIKALLTNKVDKVDGKGLSANDLSNGLKSNYDAAYTHSQAAHAPVGAEANKIDVIKVNNVALTVTGKTVNVTVPTATNDLNNNAGFQNASQVQTLINASMSGITGIDFQIVDTLPVTGVKGVIYLKSKVGSGNDIYEEFIWVTNKYEKIGDTSVDLSSCVKTTEMTVISNSEIDTILAS